MNWIHFERIIMGNSVWDYSWAFLVAGLVYFSLRLVKRIVVKKLRVLAEKTPTEWDDFVVDLLAHTKPFFFLAVAVLSAATYLNISPKGSALVQSLFIVTLLVQATFWGNEIIDFVLERQLAKRRNGANDASLETSLTAIRFLCRMALYGVILLLVLDNLGFNVTALIAGLGVGGIAVALATQNILGDLFASLSIVLDKPFVLGEFIDLGTDKGHVEKIGIKSTRLRSFTGEQIIVSNAELLKIRIHNFGRIPRRRGQILVGVVFDTSIEQLKKIPQLVQEIIESETKVTFERAHLKQIADWSLNFEIVYFVESGDYLDFVKAEQNINLKILEVFSREKIEFAFPTRTVLQRDLEA